MSAFYRCGTGVATGRACMGVGVALGVGVAACATAGVCSRVNDFGAACGLVVISVSSASVGLRIACIEVGKRDPADMDFGLVLTQTGVDAADAERAPAQKLLPVTRSCIHTLPNVASPR